MNEQLIRLTIGNAVQDAMDISHDPTFIRGYVSGKLSASILYHANKYRVDVSKSDTVSVSIQWDREQDYVTYTQQMVASPRLRIVKP